MCKFWCIKRAPHFFAEFMDFPSDKRIMESIAVNPQRSRKKSSNVILELEI